MTSVVKLRIYRNPNLFHQEVPSRSGTHPSLFDHRTISDLSIAELLLEAPNRGVIIGDDDAHALLGGRNGDIFRIFEQCRPETLPLPFRIAGENVHVPSSRSQVLQLLQRDEHRRYIRFIDGLWLIGERIANETRSDTAVFFNNYCVSITEAAFLSACSAPSD